MNIGSRKSRGHHSVAWTSRPSVCGICRPTEALGRDAQAAMPRGTAGEEGSHADRGGHIIRAVDQQPSTIKFACTCTTMLEVPIEQAGTSLQCPHCGRLVDVPSLSDLQSIAEDGTYRVDDYELKDEPERLAKLERTYSRKRVDEHGNELDLREYFKPDEAGIARIAGDDDVLEMVEDGEDAPPKYDPVTGELIRPIGLINEPVKADPTAIPMAMAVINYAGADTTPEITGWRIIPELFKFTNLFVMFLIFCVHIFLQLMMFPLMIGMWLIIPGFLFLVGALVAHYANIVNDVGPDQKDELPRPGRDLNWHDDLWGPFVQFAVAAGICYGGLAFIGKFPPGTRLPFAGTILVIGTIGFPAIFLTTTTSGTFLNLAPDKILRVVGALGVNYLWCVGMWAASAGIYIFSIVATIFALGTLLETPGAGGGSWYTSFPVILGYPALAIGIVLMHGYCWYLGLMYRRHYPAFDWYLQQHHRKFEVVRSKRGYVTMPVSSTPPRAPTDPPADIPVAKAIPAPVPPNRNHA